MQERISFRTPNGELTLTILSDRIQLLRNMNFENRRVTGTLGDFCKKASEKIPLIVEKIERKVTRITVVQVGFLPDEFLDSENDLGKRMLSVTPIFKGKPLNEWIYRVVARFDKSFGSLTEPTNSIITLLRNTFTFQKQDDVSAKFDKLSVQATFGINTVPENLVERFNSGDVANFFNMSPAWHNELTSDANEFFRERE